jgi:hypothetical protein
MRLKEFFSSRELLEATLLLEAEKLEEWLELEEEEKEND